MAAKSKTSTSTAKKIKPKVRRPGVVSKNKNSRCKQSKNYKKRYRGQGR